MGALLATGLSFSSRAEADVSSWLYLGGGASQVKNEGLERSILPSLQLETGMGSSPANSFVFGGLLRTHTYFGEGTDLALLFRGASHGFVNGGFGLAVDVGPYQRWWGEGSTGALGSVSLGMPWGVNVSASAGFGTSDAQTWGLTVGIDFARLTVYRRSGEQWWKNPFPAYRPDEPF